MTLSNTERHERAEQRRKERGVKRVTVAVPVAVWDSVTEYAAVRGIDRRAAVIAALMQLTQESQTHV